MRGLAKAYSASTGGAVPEHPGARGGGGWGGVGGFFKEESAGPFAHHSPGSLMSRLLLGLSLALAACQTSSPPKTAETPDASAPVARWSGGNISAGELDALTYPQKKQALEQLVVQRMVEQKAKAAGLATDAFLKKAIGDKTQQPTDA